MPPTVGWMTSIPEASSVFSTDNVVEGMDFSAGPDNLEMCLECDLKKCDAGNRVSISHQSTASKQQDAR